MKNLDAKIWSESYHLILPMQVPLENGQCLICEEVVRAMPGRRYVCRGTYDGKPVFIKLFSTSIQASREWRDEQQGINALTSAGIAAPEILYTESLSRLSTHIVVFRELPCAESARHRWQQGNHTARQILMMQLVELIAQHHAAGLRQKDCHLLNFVFSEDVLYTLDAADIDTASSALSRQASIQGLIDLLALFPAEQDKLLSSLYQHYWQTRNETTDTNELEKLKIDVSNLREHKLRKYLDKTYRDCSAFSVKKSWTHFSTIVRQYNKDEMQWLINSPDVDTSTIKRTLLKDGNTCTVNLLETQQQNIVCKRYNIKSVWHGLMRAFRISRASHSWRNAHRLMKFDIATPEPIALVEKRFGFIRRQAWFFMKHIDGINAYNIFHDTEKTPQQLQQAAGQFVILFEKMIQARLSHGDMKITNFIFSDDKLFVIDLDSMQQHRNDADFTAAFRIDMVRFMRNWDGLPDVAALFMEQLSMTDVTEFLPRATKG